MAVKASASITLSFMVDIKAVYRYYKLQSSTASTPSPPATWNSSSPPSGWTDAEPTYTSGSTNSLYFVDCTVFTNDTFLYSKVSKSTSYEAAKEAYNKAVSAQNKADELQTDATNRDNQYGFKYYQKVVVYGDSNKFYPVIIKYGNQNVMRDILVQRGYSEQAPNDWNRSTHKGGLTLRIRCNFGDWGGANYSWAITDFEEKYAHIFGGAKNVAQQMMFAIFLRGGGETGAVYHIYSDQSLTRGDTGGGYMEDANGNIVTSNRPSPQIAYESDLIYCSSDGIYKLYAPTPRDMVTGFNNDATKYKRQDVHQQEIDAKCYIKNSQTSVKTVDVQYYLSTSQTSLSGGSWSTTAPTWVNGKYMWSRTVTTLQNGTVTYKPSTNGICIAGAKGDTGATGSTGATGTGISSITEEYYLSDSKTSQTGGSWSTTAPTWSAGKYIWTRSKIVYTNPSSTSYTTPICDSSWEAINDVEIGGRNLLRNSEELIVTASSASQYSYVNIYTDLVIGDTYTLSVESSECTAGTATKFTVLMYDGSITSSIGTFDIGTTKVSKTFVAARPRVIIYAGQAGSTAGNTVIYRNLKLEKGDKATDWTPAPEDVQDGIDDAQSSADRANNNNDVTNEELQKTRQQLEILEGLVYTLVEAGKSASLWKQDENGWTFATTDIANNAASMSTLLDEIAKDTGDSKSTIAKLESALADVGAKAEYIRIGQYPPDSDDAEPCIELGENDTNYKLLITNTRFIFCEGTNILSFIDNKGVNTDNIILTGELRHDDFTWSVSETGHYSLKGEVGENLFLNSNRGDSNNEYMIGAYWPFAATLENGLVPGEVYTASICFTPGDGVTHLHLFVSSGYVGLGQIDVSGVNRQVQSITFTMPSYYTGKTPSDDLTHSYVQFYRFPNDGSVTSNTTIHWVKIERGNKATSWILSQDEINASVI